MNSSFKGEIESQDHYHAVYFGMFYQGISNLLPWNVLIFAYDYFEMRLRNVPEASNFLLHFVLIFMTMKFLFLISGIKITYWIRPDLTVQLSIGMNASIFLIIGIICAIPTINLKTYYYILIIVVLMAALFSAFIEAGFLAILAHFPSCYTQSYMVGHGFAGVVTALLHLSSAMGTSSALSKRFAELYFGFTAFIIFLSAFLFRYMKELDMFQHYFKKGQAVQLAKVERERLAQETGMHVEQGSSYREVLCKTYDLILTVFIITWFNLLISPLLILMTQSSAKEATIATSSKSFFHVFALLICSVFDLIGRCLPAISSLALTKMPFLAAASARLLFLPLFIFGNIRLEGFELPFYPLYKSDWLFFIIIAVKAFTGGYFSTLCIMWTPFRVHEVDRNKAVTLVVYSLGFALLAGAISAYLLKQLLMYISIKA